MFFLSYWPNCNLFTAQWARHWSDPQQNRRAERWARPTVHASRPLFNCTTVPILFITYTIYILYIHITFTFYGQCWLFRQHNLQFIMRHILIVSKQNYAQHFYYLKSWSLKIGCVKISSFFWLKYRLSFG